MEGGGTLPEDVLIEIFVHLPIKSLLRFRCISKYWCDLIISPNFVSRHLRRDCNDILLLINKLPRPPQDTNEGGRGGGGGQVLSFHDPDSLDLLVSPNLSLPPFLDNIFGDLCCSFMGTCNGLVCLEVSTSVILCNPALREFELLPPSPFGWPEGYIPSSIMTGFGFDSIIDAYKVVQLWLMVDNEKDYPQVYEDAWTRIVLYNSSTNSWRLIDAVVPRVMDNSGFNLFLNGACHWESRGQPHGILSFDLRTEVFRHFECPRFGDVRLAKLLVLNQCLALVRFGKCYYHGGLWTVDPQQIEIWVMKEYGVKESWTKELVIGSYHIDYPIMLLKNEWLLVTKHDDSLVSCALYDNEIKGSHVNWSFESSIAAIFNESLISLKQVIQKDTTILLA